MAVTTSTRTATETGTHRRRLRFRPVRLSTALLLIVLAVVTVLPFYLMFVWATHDRSTIFAAPPPFTFGDSLGRNLDALTQDVPFYRNMWNSIYIAVMATVTRLFFCSLGGFAFALYEFRGKRLLFGLVIASLLLPSLINIIPHFLVIDLIGWLDTPRALWVPGMADAFGIFLMRQFIASTISRELLDAARIDGASEFRIFRSIAVPLIRPGMATLALLTFIGLWNSFMGPLVLLRSRDTYTLPLALRSLQGLVSTDWGAVMVGTALAVLPLFIIFFLASRQVIEGLTAGSVKG